MRLPPLESPLSPILYATLSIVLRLSLSLFLAVFFLHFSPPLCEHRYLWNLLHRARALHSASLARSLVSRLVSSRLEEAPGTRNVSISVTVDGVPSRVSRLPTTGQKEIRHSRRVPIYTRRVVSEYFSGINGRYTPRMLVLSSVVRASANFFNRARFH